MSNRIRLFLFIMLILPPLAFLLIIPWVGQHMAPTGRLFTFVTGSCFLTLLAVMPRVSGLHRNPNMPSRWRFVLKNYPNVVILLILAGWSIGAVFSDWTWKSLVTIVVLNGTLRVLLEYKIPALDGTKTTTPDTP